MEEKNHNKSKAISNIIERCKVSVENFNKGKEDIEIIANDEEYYIALGMIYQMAVNNMPARPKQRNVVSRPLLNAKTNKECIKAFMSVYKKSDINPLGWQGILISETIMYKDEEVNLTDDDKINIMIGWITNRKNLGEV